MTRFYRHSRRKFFETSFCLVLKANNGTYECMQARTCTWCVRMKRQGKMEWIRSCLVVELFGDALWKISFFVFLGLYDYTETGIFGVPLTTLLERDQKRYPHLKCPLFLTEVLTAVSAGFHLFLCVHMCICVQACQVLMVAFLFPTCSFLSPTRIASKSYG